MTAEVNGCRLLAEVCDDTVSADPNIAPHQFLQVLGMVVAGIDPGLEGVFDLITGGSNEIWGTGFKPEFDDGTTGQARHFAGTAASAGRFGPGPTERFAHTFLDKPDTPDGRLTTKAVEFASLILDGTLLPSETGDWVRRELCLNP